MGLEPPPPLSSCTTIPPLPSMDNAISKPPLSNLHIQGSISLSNLAPASSDFGNSCHHSPLAFIQPSSVDDILAILRYAAASPGALTVAARGNGHSISGQAQARDGLVIDMRSLGGIEVCDGEVPYVDACGGELWIDVLKACLQRGYAPPSWPDYLYLTVGGTLQNAGVGGQTFKYGPAISNVLQLEVVTGRGELYTCSPTSNEDLFFAMLGGLGQFGIITKARILLVRAPEKVRWIRMVYEEVGEFTRDQEALIKLQVEKGEEGFDYVEGFVVCNNEDPVNGWGQVPFTPTDAHQFDPSLIQPTSGPFLYCLEVAKHYSFPHQAHPQHSMDQVVEELQRELGYIRGLSFSKDVGYLEFLNRVHAQEEVLRELGMWQAPHPWLCLLVPRSHILVLHDLMFLHTNLTNGVGGPMHMYPMLKSKWDTRASVVTPEDEIFYLVSLLRSNFPPPKGPKAETLVQENEEILGLLESANIPFKVYMPHFKSPQDCLFHFGSHWQHFVSLKQAFDPLAILAPGQSIFPRQNPHSLNLVSSIV
eukprot:c14357_g1_i1 orf=159-1763(+)